MNKKVLITGSEGLIGKKLVQFYSSLNYKVIGYDWLPDKNGEHWHWNTIKNESFDIIHHCASQCVIRDVIANPSQSYQNNQITFKVLEHARKHPPKQLFLYSSNRVTANIENPYVTSKKYMEQLAEGYRNCYGLDYVMIRPETIWGYKKNDIRVIPAWIDNAYMNKDIIIYGPEDKELSPLYVDYFVNKILFISDNYETMKNQTWTITGETRKAKDLAENIKSYLNSNSNIIFKEGETAQPQKCIKRDNNEIIITPNLKKEIKKYLEEKNDRKN